MKTPDLPATDWEPPFVEERSKQHATQTNGAQAPEPVALSPAEQEARLSTPTPSISSFERPVVRSGFPPESSSPWPFQPETATSYPPRKPVRWPWIVLALSLAFVLICGSAVVLFGIAGLTGYANVATEETRTFAVSAYPTLVLKNDTGSIHVHAALSGSVITIQATKHGSFGSNLNDIQVSYAQATATNTLTVTVDRVNTISFFHELGVDFDVTVPSAATLQMQTNTGSIDVSGVSGQMALASNTGSLRVSGGTVKGTTTLITDTGPITFDGAIAASGTYAFTTTTGPVNVTLPVESTFHLDASTTTGSINTNMPGIVVQPHQGTGADAHGDVGSSPQTTLTLSTTTGSINLYQR